MSNCIKIWNGENKIKFSHKSFMDDFGRVFFYKNRVFRRINLGKANFCITLLNSQLFNELYAKGYLPQTKISDEFKDDNLILEHQKILQTLQHEWSFSMFKEAALMVLEVNEICNKYGYELKDAHTMNVLFQNCHPVFIDIGSIDLKNKYKKRPWVAYNEYLNSFFIPLLFWSKGNHYLVRKLLESDFYKIQTKPEQTIYSSGLLELINVKTYFYSFKMRHRELFRTKQKINGVNFIVKLIKNIKNIFWLPSILTFSYEKKNIELPSLFPMQQIKETIKELEMPTIPSEWSGYHERNYGLAPIFVENDKSRFKEIFQLIKNEKEIKSVIDLAGNEGYFSIMLSRQLNIERIIMADNDENAVESAFHNFKNLNLKNITPVLLNFMFTNDVEGTAQRLKSDLVVALAVTHHLILTSKYTLPAIFERLCSFSNSLVMVEFMPLGLWSPSLNNAPPVPEWYSVEWFRNEFLNYFDLKVERPLEKNRILFYGKIKRSL